MAKLEDCDKCGGEYLMCKHSAGACEWCPESDRNYVVLRGKCIFCLFDGKDWEDEWDDLAEVLTGIALAVYNLGKKQGKSGHRALYLCQNKTKEVKALYKLYKAGYKSGAN